MRMTAEQTIEAQIRSASKLDPDRLSRLKLLSEDWANATERTLNELYAAPVAIEFIEVASLTFSISAPDLAQSALAMVVRSTQWRETGFVLADAFLANVLVEAMFGGGGNNAAPAARPMTRLDRRFVETALAAFIRAANPIFDPVAPLDMSPGEVLAGGIAPQLDERIAPDGRAFVEVIFRVTVGRTESTVRFALPERAVAPHRRKLTVVPEEAQFADVNWTREIEEGLQHADLEVRALLDEQQITLGAVAGFTLGQTIMLNATMDSLIIIECEEQRLFRGRMGRARDSYVVRIEERIDPTEEFIDDILSD